MNKKREFRKMYLSENDYFKREVFVNKFLKGEMALDKPINRNIIFEYISKFSNNNKSNFRVVVDELKRTKIDSIKYNELFKALKRHKNDHPDLCSEQDLQELFDIYIKNLHIIFQKNKKNPNNFDLINNLKYLYMFDTIMNESNFKRIYSLVSEIVRPKINEYEKLEKKPDDSDLIEEILFIIESASTVNQNSQENLNNIFNIIGDDLNLYYKYDSSLLSEAKIFSNYPQSKKGPKDLLDFYEYIMNNNADNWRIMNFFIQMNKQVIQNISWTQSDFKNFFSLVSKENKMDLALGFMIIDSHKGESSELNEIFNEFLTKHKKDYMLYCMNNHDPEYYIGCIRGKNKNYTDSDIETYTYIVDELIERQQEQKNSYIDIESCGRGGTSTVHRIGDYVVKNGVKRFSESIPNHRRILQPIIRCYNEEMFIEVADAVIPHCSQSMAEQIYDEMLNEGFFWADPRSNNIGILKRPNIPRHNIQKKVNTKDGVVYIEDQLSSDEVATEIKGQNIGEPLKAGEYVILDTDLIFDLRDPATYEKNIYYQKCMTTEMRDKLAKKTAEIKAENIKKDNR